MIIIKHKDYAINLDSVGEIHREGDTIYFEKIHPTPDVYNWIIVFDDKEKAQEVYERIFEVIQNHSIYPQWVVEV